MTSLSRLVLLALLLLLGFLGIAFTVQWWLNRETTRVRQEAIAARTLQLDAALALAARPPEAWDENYRRELGLLIGGFVTLRRSAVGPGPGPGLMEQALRFERPLPGHPGWMVHADLRLPGLERLKLMHQRTLVATVLLAAVLVLVPLWVGVFSNRSGASSGSRHPWASVRAEAAGLEHFARMSVERGDALEKEHDARRRAEENLQVSRTQLDRSLAERVRLGRELHDNISQTLYAVTLTLESVRRKLPATGETTPRLDQCMAELKRLNQEVRAFLRELEPDQVHREPFAAALTAMLAGLPGGGDIRVERRIDDETAALIPTHCTADVVNILREAISNSLRHGRARVVTLRAERNDDSVALAVTDDGAGFDATEPGSRRGHGLANMQARAAAIGGSVRVSSTPGKGTRVLLILPVASPA